MARKSHDPAQVQELLYQALETELGGIRVYETAIECAVNQDLREEWQEYLEETRRHRDILLGVFDELGLDPARKTPGREVVAHLGESLVEAMRMAREAGDPAAAELVASECVVLAETKDHQNWSLIGRLAEHLGGAEGKTLLAAYEEVVPDENHHLYHTAGWSRELWLQSLGVPAVLPPPEEVKHADTVVDAIRAQQQRESLLKKRH
ncbi:ferritin-like domain-containing protein [Vulcaniibacterium tengchongense]|uniref:Ferritin-like metal-binding protein YciE n=1 Tax=Vulcaniibacterium tengchongense TaxID=1273429 RepID=A0A3N4VED6_9GAMM|nr:ferritin-like domain-containing protein [Vulcaniibacterium tengchongense]RPE79865.1 hypothetical protein EDC50_1694 [Vulcaniibacterium tengchongense]